MPASASWAIAMPAQKPQLSPVAPASRRPVQLGYRYAEPEGEAPACGAGAFISRDEVFQADAMLALAGPISAKLPLNLGIEFGGADTKVIGGQKQVGDGSLQLAKPLLGGQHRWARRNHYAPAR